MRKIRTFLPNERGFTLAGALAIIAIIAIFWALTVPLWARVKQRDNEEELIFRGNEYIEAIARYHQKFGTYPPDLDTLEKLKYIRKLYLDPMTKSGKWKVLHPDALAQTGQAGQINTPGGRNNNQNQNQNSNGGLNPQPGDGDEDEDDEEDVEEGGDKDQLPGMESEEEEEEEKLGEEKETESVGPVVGVVSRSKKASIKIYNGQDKYNKWKFVYALPQQQQPQQPPGKQPPGGKPKPGPPKPPPTGGGAPVNDDDDDDN